MMLRNNKWMSPDSSLNLYQEQLQLAQSSPFQSPGNTGPQELIAE